jgi:hypothetical protein
MVQPNGLTNIAGAIANAATGLLGFASDAPRQIIDVSTDGQGNIGLEDDAADAAVAAGINAVNCLGIGAAANCGFIAGVGAFTVTAASFADFENALENKLAQEVGQVPGPPTLLLLVTALPVLANLSRRRRRESPIRQLTAQYE